MLPKRPLNKKALTMGGFFLWFGGLGTWMFIAFYLRNETQGIIAGSIMLAPMVLILIPLLPLAFYVLVKALIVGLFFDGKESRLFFIMMFGTPIFITSLFAALFDTYIARISGDLTVAFATFFSFALILGQILMFDRVANTLLRYTNYYAVTMLLLTVACFIEAFAPVPVSQYPIDTTSGCHTVSATSKSGVTRHSLACDITYTDEHGSVHRLNDMGASRSHGILEIRHALFNHYYLK